MQAAKPPAGPQNGKTAEGQLARLRQGWQRGLSTVQQVKGTTSFWWVLARPAMQVCITQRIAAASGAVHAWPGSCASEHLKFSEQEQKQAAGAAAAAGSLSRAAQSEGDHIFLVGPGQASHAGVHCGADWQHLEQCMVGLAAALVTTGTSHSSSSSSSGSSRTLVIS